MKEYLMLQIYIIISGYMDKLCVGADTTNIQYEKEKITLEIEKDKQIKTFEISIKEIK